MNTHLLHNMSTMEFNILLTGAELGGDLADLNQSTLGGYLTMILFATFDEGVSPAMLREKIGAIACFRESNCVARLPKTRSGKILRGTMVKIADSQEYKVPATIDDPAILDEIRDALQGLGYAKA